MTNEIIKIRIIDMININTYKKVKNINDNLHDNLLFNFDDFKNLIYHINIIFNININPYEHLHYYMSYSVANLISIVEKELNK